MIMKMKDGCCLWTICKMMMVRRRRRMMVMKSFLGFWVLGWERRLEEKGQKKLKLWGYERAHRNEALPSGAYTFRCGRSHLNSRPEGTSSRKPPKESTHLEIVHLCCSNCMAIRTWTDPSFQPNSNMTPNMSHSLNFTGRQNPTPLAVITCMLGRCHVQKIYVPSISACNLIMTHNPKGSNLRHHSCSRRKKKKTESSAMKRQCNCQRSAASGCCSVWWLQLSDHEPGRRSIVQPQKAPAEGVVEKSGFWPKFIPDFGLVNTIFQDLAEAEPRKPAEIDWCFREFSANLTFVFIEIDDFMSPFSNNGQLISFPRVRELCHFFHESSTCDPLDIPTTRGVPKPAPQDVGKKFKLSKIHCFTIRKKYIQKARCSTNFFFFFWRNELYH
ncbi:hypothetical protein VP01_3962g2 [Puccinia sorghi]|uniref:Uncharacterized protein n=1 Tax=Puccinia sorghi TaxID=27349 RepID=A0A0L6USA9_9BASI|nr:hypothetical protein VP01_3962g2 [Puccinia sorghi]